MRSARISIRLRVDLVKFCLRDFLRYRVNGYQCQARGWASALIPAEYPWMASNTDIDLCREFV